MRNLPQILSIGIAIDLIAVLHAFPFHLSHDYIITPVFHIGHFFYKLPQRGWVLFQLPSNRDSCAYFYWRVEIVAEMVNLMVILLVQCFVVDSWAKPSIKRTVNPPVDVLSFNSTQLIRTVKELTVRDQC